MQFLKPDYKKLSDEDLMAMLLKKNQLAFEELYLRYSKKLFSYFYRMLNRNKDKAKDFLHDLFLKIIEKPQLFDPARSFSPWFYSLAFNMCKNEYKKIKIRDDYSASYASSVNSTDKFIDDDLDLNSFIRELYLHLEDVDNDHRSAFLLRYGNNLSIKEIAETMDCPEGTVKSRLYYTIKYLSDKLTIYKPEKNI
ncbi:MAG: RNA polymerase sigma factor [Ignavibacteriaceae bacterium]|nr:RNA polymerase sigma factor [Ignavibacteriaceae bacterium]